MTDDPRQRETYTRILANVSSRARARAHVRVECAASPPPPACAREQQLYRRVVFRCVICSRSQVYRKLLKEF